MYLHIQQHNLHRIHTHGIRITNSSYIWICTRTNDGVEEGLEDRMNRLAALGIPALLTIIMLTSQSAAAKNIGGFDCSVVGYETTKSA